MISTFLLNKLCIFQKVWQIQPIAFSSEFSDMLKTSLKTGMLSQFPKVNS